MFKIILAALLCVSAALPVFAGHTRQSPRRVRAAKKPAPHEAVTGGDGVFGKAYLVSDGGEYGPVNFTLLRAECSAGRFNIAGRATVVPQADEKLLVLHYRIQNPNRSDFFFASRPLFQTEDADEQIRGDLGDSRRESQKEKVAATMKPGQSLDDLVTCAVIPAHGPLPKLLLTLGRVGVDEAGISYPLGAGKNLVKPIPAPYADPADPGGATARAEVPARMGTAYVAGGYDVALVSIGYAPGPLDSVPAGEGQRFLVATVTVTNRNWETSYFDAPLAATLTTSDDVKTSGFMPLAAAKNVYFDGQDLEPGASLTLRLAFTLSQEASAKTLKIAERLDDLGALSHALVYDLSGAKGSRAVPENASARLSLKRLDIFSPQQVYCLSQLNSTALTRTTAGCACFQRAVAGCETAASHSVSPLRAGRLNSHSEKLRLPGSRP